MPATIEEKSGSGNFLRPLLRRFRPGSAVSTDGAISRADSHRFAIPIYLNQRIVFDQLAIVEEGFSQLRTIKTSESSSEQQGKSAEGQLGVTNAFAFLDVGLRAGRRRERESNKHKEISEERVFTPASLFSRLRDVLKENGLLTFMVDDSNFEGLCPGTFVEFSAVLRKNPLIEALEQFVRLGELLAMLQNYNSAAPVPRSKNSRTTIATATDPETSKMMNLFRNLLDSLTQSGSLDLVASMVDRQSVAVVPVDLDYFEDRSPAAIIDGQFTALGKIVRTVGGPGESINLLRATSLGTVSPDMIRTLVEGFEGAKNFGIDIPQIITQVPGPVIQVIPIGIYV